MTFTLTEILVLILGHFIADYILQDGNWTTTKVDNFTNLIKHTLTYTLFWSALLWMIAIWRNYFNGPSMIELGWTPWMLLFIPITFFIHTIIDYHTSKLIKKVFMKKIFGTSIPNTGFFTTLGLEQLLHYIQLFLTYGILKSF